MGVPSAVPRVLRLSRRSEFQRVYDQGHKAHGRFMTLFVLPTGSDRSRLGVAATRKIGGAVSRNRAKRRVAGAGGGVVTVSFTISASGEARGIRISASSGQPELDQAAMDAVRRATPFPRIPAEAGRSSWSFSVPIAFKR